MIPRIMISNQSKGFLTPNKNLVLFGNKRRLFCSVLKVDKRIDSISDKRFFCTNSIKNGTKNMKQPMSFKEFKEKKLETFKEFKEKTDISEHDSEPKKMDQFYADYCNIKYNQYLTDLSGHNPTHAFDFKPETKS